MIDLRAVGEIAELRLPQHERVRLGEAVAIFEAEHGLLGKHRVDDLEARLLLARCGSAGCTALRSPDRSARRAAARRCRVRHPAPKAGRGSPLRAACRTRAPRPSTSRCPRPSSIILRRFASSRSIVLCVAKPFGTSVSFEPILFERVEADARSAAARAFLGERDAGPAPVEPVRLVRAIAF